MATDRLAYRVAEVCELAGVPRSSVERAIRRNQIRVKRVGRMLLLEPYDVSRLFGFGTHEEITPSAESLAEIEDLLSR